MSNYPDFVRILNMILAIVSLVLLGRKFILYWPRYQSKTKDYWWVLVCWSLALLFGSMEIVFNWDTQFRVLFTLFAMLLTIKVLLRTNEVDHPTFTKEM